MRDHVRPAPRRVLLLCGGRSEEHDVSLASARSVLEAVAGSPSLEVSPLVIGRGGATLSLSESAARLGVTPARLEEAGHAANGDSELSAPSAGRDGLTRSLAEARSAYDVVFPLLHGPYGEDGSLQGLLKVMGVPFVGSDVLGSAVAMDKLAMKAVLAAAGLPQVEHRAVTRAGYRADPVATVATLDELGKPVFVKPANLGSSIGVTRVDDGADMAAALESALTYDRRAIVEAAAVGARELEVAVLGNDAPLASGVGEIRYDAAGGAFYDFETKYTDGRADLLIPADVPPEVAESARRMALEAFAAVDAAGLARVDFFYLPDGALLVNEINTIPGFTRHSMYPRLWQAAGVGYAELVERLVELALEPR